MFRQTKEKLLTPDVNGHSKTLAAATASFTITETPPTWARQLWMMGMIKGKTAAGNFTLRPNGLTTNQRSDLFQWTPSLSDGAPATFTSLFMGGTTADQAWCWFKTVLYLNNVGPRAFENKHQRFNVPASTVPEVRLALGSWDSNAPLTSFDIVISAGEMDVGSFVDAYWKG